jgi:hypothetical protein
MSRREDAFQLFDQGKRPGDDEVKTLGLTAKTRYNYFQQWKRKASLGSYSADEIDDIADLKHEKAKLTLQNQIDDLEARRAKLPDRMDKLETYLDAVVEYVGEVLDRIETLADCGFTLVFQMQPDEVDKEAVAHTLGRADAAKAFLGNADPIPEKLRKLKPRA